MKRIYILYDSRAQSGDTDDAAVLSTAHTLAEIRRDRDRLFPGQGAVIYVYDKGRGAIPNERRVE